MTRRIAIFSGIFPPETGGPAKFGETFSAYLNEQNYPVRVYAYSSSGSHQWINHDSKAVLISNQLPLALRYIRMIFHILKEAWSGSLIIANGCFWEIAIARHIKKFKYVTKVPGDIVWERARNNGKTQSSIDEYNRENQNHYKILRYLFIFSLRKSQLTIVPSLHLMKLCKLWGIRDSNVALIGNSVSTKKFFPDLSVTKFFDFISVCRLVSWKGVDAIIDAAAELNSRLLVVGDGPERTNLEMQSRKLNADVQFIGNVSQDELPRLLRESNAFVLNSTFEATSYALLEAQSTGLLVVANEMTGSEEVIVPNLNGFLCGPKSGMNLIEAMKKCLEDTDENANIKIEARRNVMVNFSLEVNYEKILRLSLSI